MKKYNKNPFLLFEPFHIISGNVGIFDIYTNEELELLLEAMEEWEHYNSCIKIKREIDKRKNDNRR